MLEVTESGIYATCVLKDYGTHQVMIYYKNNVRKKGYEEIKDDEDVYNEKYNDCDIVIDESYIERLKNCVEEQTKTKKRWDMNTIYSTF